MHRPEVAVVDYGVGNLLSVQRSFEYCGARVVVTSDTRQIVAAERVVLPGVGAFRSAMSTLTSLGLDSAIREVARRGTPLLCICLGMQLLLDASEEFGTTAGLSLIPGRVIAIPDRARSSQRQKIPHVGWSALQPAHDERGWKGTLLQDNDPGEATYFAHAFTAVPANPEHRIANCVYGGHVMAAAIGRDNITGCQFHPEKSGEAGLKILRRFLLQ